MLFLYLSSSETRSPKEFRTLPELLPGRLRGLATGVGELVIPVRGRTVLSAGEGPALEELLLDIGRTSGGEAGDHPVFMCHEAVERHARQMERCGPGVRPGVVVEGIDGWHARGTACRRADFVAWPA